MSFKRAIPKVTTGFRYKRPTFTVPFTVSKTPSVFIPSDLDPELVDFSPFYGKQRELFRLDSKYLSPADFGYKPPDGNVPEFAFVGRSNVGKSSLIRTLLGNDKIVRVSSTPGCTQSVNYYSLYRGANSAQIYLVDLPGYGFAASSKTNQQDWKRMINGFLNSRHPTILRYCILVNKLWFVS